MKIIDLFCGAGGMSLGFESAGFETELAIDLWYDAIVTFNKNRTKSVAQCINISEFTDEKLLTLTTTTKIHGIIGGPPCQGFSSVGKREGSDERNSLYLEYVRFVNTVKPDFFILENVKGLLTLNGGKYKEDIIDRFTELGFNVSFKVLKASDFGIPQHRERVFFVGLRRNVFGNDVFFPFPTRRNELVTTSDAISDLPSLDSHELLDFYRTPPQCKYQIEMRRDSIGIYNHEKTNHTNQTISIISRVPDGGSILDLDPELYKIRNYKTTFKRMNSKQPSITIDCGHRNYFHYCENRVPSVRESARIQSFFDTYIFYGSKTSQYTQVGNAVPPMLAQQLAEIIRSFYQEVN